MANEVSILTELGEDTELLLAPDDWLENKRVHLQQRLSMLAEELDGILIAQRLKRQLQQSNLVAVRCVEKKFGVPSDIIIKVCQMSDAISRLEDERHDPSIPSDVSEKNARQQIDVWKSDGYDVEAAERIGKNKKPRS